MLSLLPSCATFWCWFQALRVASQCFSWRWSVDRSDAGDNNEFSAVGLRWCALSRWSIHSKPDGDITWRFVDHVNPAERASVKGFTFEHVGTCWNYKSYTQALYIHVFSVAWHGSSFRCHWTTTCGASAHVSTMPGPWRDGMPLGRIWIRLCEQFATSWLVMHARLKTMTVPKKNRGFMGFLYVYFLSTFNPLHYPNTITLLKCISAARVLQDI